MSYDGADLIQDISNTLEHYGVVPSAEIEDLWMIAEHVETLLIQRRRLIEALQAARDALYNGFEPDNQSRAWHEATAVLDGIGPL